MKKSNSLVILLLIHCMAFGQMQDYGYKRPITGIEDQWHKIELPADLFSKVKNNLADLRIYGVDATNDTVEAPYLLKVGKEVIENETVQFSILNQSRKGGKYFISLRVPKKQMVNKIVLHFAETNFDYLVKIEGSTNQKDWFEIARDKRILSIQNEQTKYSYTDLNFGDSQYEFYRLSFLSDLSPTLSSAETSRYVVKESNSEVQTKAFDNRRDDKKSKQTVLDVALDQFKPVHKIRLEVGSTFDFYRRIKIEHLVDSAQDRRGAENAYRYINNTLYNGTLSSIEQAEFNFPSTIVKNLRITIENGSNQSLDFNKIKLYSYKHELIARFTEPATYFLHYGNDKAAFPNYDIALFENKIPGSLVSANLGKESSYREPVFKEEEQEPFFKNKAWLWGVMVFIIVLLGGFTFKMLKKVDEEA